jgi:hypothetical protein
LTDSLSRAAFFPMESLPGFRVPPAREEAMTAAIEQEATAIFAAELAAFLDEAIAKLDTLGFAPSQQPKAAEAGQPPQAEKPARKPRKKRV